MVEYSSRQARGTLRLLDEAASRDQHIHNRGPQHDLNVIYSLTLGFTDLLSLRFSRSLYPFAALPSATAASSRRCIGTYIPSSTELRAWSNYAQAKPDQSERPAWLGPLDPQDRSLHIAPHDPLRPFLVVVHLDVNPIAFQLSRGEERMGPVRRGLGALARRFPAEVFEWGRDDSGRGVTAQILPLLGMDRVPLSLVIRASDIEQVGQIVWECRRLKLGELWATGEQGAALEALGMLRLPLPLGLDKTPREWTRDDLLSQPLFTDSVTVLGAELQYVAACSSGLMLPADLRTPGGRGVWVSPGPLAAPDDRPSWGEGRWRIGGDGADNEKVAVPRGGFVGYVRRPSHLDSLNLSGLAELVGMHAVNDTGGATAQGPAARPEDLWYFGPLDGVAFKRSQSKPAQTDAEAAGPGPNDAQAFRRRDVFELLHDVTLGADLSGSDPCRGAAGPLPAERVERMVGSIHTHTVAYLAASMPPDDDAPTGEPSLLAWAFDDAFARAAQRLGQHDSLTHGEQRAGWQQRWLRASTSSSLSYSFTTAGSNLIASTVQLIETDLPTFFEMEEAVERLVYAAERAALYAGPERSYSKRKGTAESGHTLVPRQLFHLFQGLERLYDSRIRRSPPIRRDSRPGPTFDILPGYRASRQGFSALCQAEATLLGLDQPILFLDSSFSETSIRTELGAIPGCQVSLMEVPISTFLTPVSWRISHEFGHEALKLPILDFGGNCNPRAGGDSTAADGDAPLAAALRDFATTAKRMQQGQNEYGPPDRRPRSIENHDRSVDGSLARCKAWLDAQFPKQRQELQEVELLEAITASLRELPADLLWARAMHREGEPVGGAPDAMRRFWWHYGLNMVHAHQEKAGSGPLSDPMAQAMLLRVILLSLVISRVEALYRQQMGGASAGLMDWKEGFRAVRAQIELLLVAGRPDHVPQRRRDPEEDAAASLAATAADADPDDPVVATAARVICLWLDLDADGDLDRCYDRLSILLLQTECQLDLRPFAGHSGRQVEPMIHSWLQLCQEVYRSPRMQPAPECEAQAWQIRQRYLDYLDAVIASADREIRADAGDSRSVPWLACDKGWRVGPQLSHMRPDWRRPGPRSPWTSHRGGIRAGRDDSSDNGFYDRYHQETIQLLLDLAHRNRARRFKRLQALINGTDGTDGADGTDGE